MESRQRPSTQNNNKHRDEVSTCVSAGKHSRGGKKRREANRTKKARESSSKTADSRNCHDAKIDARRDDSYDAHSTYPREHEALELESRMEAPDYDYSRSKSDCNASRSTRYTNASKSTRYTKSSRTSDIKIHTEQRDGIDSFELVVPPKRSGQSKNRGNNGKKNKDVASVASTAAQSQASEPPSSSMAFWSELSVKAALAVMQADGSDYMAEMAANAVLEAGEKKSHSRAALDKLASKVSLAVFDAGGNHKVAAAVTMAIVMNQDTSDMMLSRDKSREKNHLTNDTGTKHSIHKIDSGDIRDIPSLQIGAEAKSSSNSKDCLSSKDEKSVMALSLTGSKSSQTVSIGGIVSMTSSVSSKQRHLKQKEVEFAQKNKNLEEVSQKYLQVARANLQKEIEISERLAALDAAEAALLEKSNKAQLKKLELSTNSMQKKSDISERVEETEEEKLVSSIKASQPEVANNNTRRTEQSGLMRPIPESECDSQGSSVELQAGVFSVATEDASSRGEKVENNTNESSSSPEGEKATSAFEEITGRLYSFLDSSWISPQPNKQSNTASAASSRQKHTDEMSSASYSTYYSRRDPEEKSHATYNTNSTDSTSLVTNRTGDLSKQSTKRTAMSALTDDQRTWNTSVSALTEDTGRRSVRWNLPLVGRDNATTRSPNQASPSNPTNQLLNQALYQAMKQNKHPIGDPSPWSNQAVRQATHNAPNQYPPKPMNQYSTGRTNQAMEQNRVPPRNPNPSSNQAIGQAMTQNQYLPQVANQYPPKLMNQYSPSHLNQYSHRPPAMDQHSPRVSDQYPHQYTNQPMIQNMAMTAQTGMKSHIPNMQTSIATSPKYSSRNASTTNESKSGRQSGLAKLKNGFFSRSRKSSGRGRKSVVGHTHQLSLI